MATPGLIIQPPKNEAELNEIIELVQKITNSEKVLITKDGQSIEVPQFVSQVLYEILSILSKGGSMTIIPMEKELTTQQAADILNVCRPYLVKLLEKNEIPFRKVGSHRKILMRDLIAYKDRVKINRKEKLSELVNLSQELGLYD